MSEVLPAIAGPYALQRLLATGSQSQVWLATGPTGDVALKVARTEGHRDALRREARVLEGGSHPGLPKLLEIAPDGAWLAIERIDGAQIDQWAQVQDPEEVVRAVGELLDVLDHLHGRNILHGDIKPSNVLVDLAGHVHLIDLGVADFGEGDTSFRGTLGYAAPERLQSRAATPLSDYYGVGALLYTCLTGRAPFVAEDPAALTYLPLVSLPCPPSSLVPDLTVGFDKVLLTLLSRDPAKRPQSSKRIRSQLHKALDSRAAKPVLGMEAPREAIRRAVVGAADGEARVVVLYGPPGSGRRTLLSEAINAARREGLSFHKGTELRGVLEAIKASKAPVVAALRGTSRTAQKLAELVLKDGMRCLLLLHADRPLPTLASQGAIQLTPSPLAPLDVTRLCRINGVDEAEAARWWRESMGLPASVMGHIRAWRREHFDEPPDHSVLRSDCRALLAILTEAGPLTVPEFAERAKMTETELLDHCEGMFAEGLIEPLQDGEAIGLVDLS